MRSHFIPRLSQIALGLLALTLPFELKTPLLSVGPIVVTNVEAVLYLAVALWLISRLLIRTPFRATWTPLHSAVIGWIAVLIVSAVAAPTFRIEAIKFALRSLGGCLVFFAAADGLREAHVRRWLLITLLIGASVSALAGLAEVWLPTVADSLTVFKTQPSM